MSEKLKALSEQFERQRAQNWLEMNAVLVVWGFRECFVATRNVGRFTNAAWQAPLYRLDQRLKEVARITWRPRHSDEISDQLDQINAATELVFSGQEMSFLVFLNGAIEQVAVAAEATPTHKRPYWDRLLLALNGMRDALDPEYAREETARIRESVSLEILHRLKMAESP